MGYNYLKPSAITRFARGRPFACIVMSKILLAKNAARLSAHMRSGNTGAKGLRMKFKPPSYLHATRKDIFLLAIWCVDLLTKLHPKGPRGE